MSGFFRSPHKKVEDMLHALKNNRPYSLSAVSRSTVRNLLIRYEHEDTQYKERLIIKSFHEHITHPHDPKMERQ